MRNFVITAESVTRGHPDKLCDQISDAVVDACLAANGHHGDAVAECALASGMVFLSVRSGPEPPCDLAGLARRVIAEAGYDGGEAPPAVILQLATGPAGGMVDAPLRGEMTTAFGYACDHTPQALPLPLAAAHALARGMEDARRAGTVDWLTPDAQVQVAVEFRDRRAAAVPALSLVFGATRTLDPREAEGILRETVVAPAFAGMELPGWQAARIACRPVAGPTGPAAHAGLTGRKGAIDTYGGYSRQSAAALSGKTPGRIDRTAQYAARQAARCVVAAGLARECEVQLSYILGRSGPVTVEVDSFETGTMDDDAIAGRLAAAMDFRREAIAERLALWELPARHAGRFYAELACFGQMGRDELAPPWEDTGPSAALA